MALNQSIIVILEHYLSRVVFRFEWERSCEIFLCFVPMRIRANFRREGTSVSEGVRICPGAPPATLRASDSSPFLSLSSVTFQDKLNKMGRLFGDLFPLRFPVFRKKFRLWIVWLIIQSLSGRSRAGLGYTFSNIVRLGRVFGKLRPIFVGTFWSHCSQFSRSSCCGCCGSDRIRLRLFFNSFRQFWIIRRQSFWLLVSEDPANLLKNPFKVLRHQEVKQALL